MNTAYHHEIDRPVAVKFNDDMVWVTRADGRVIGNPLSWHPWLASAMPAQREKVEFNPFDVWWTELDEGLDIDGMLQGIKPRVPQATES